MGTMRMWTGLLAVLLLAGGANLGGCDRQRVDDDQSGTALPGDVAPLVIHQRFHGDQSGIRDAKAIIVNSREHLEEFGSDQLAAVPTDFSKRSLLVLSMGQRPTGGYWVWIDAVQRAGDKLYVQGRVNRPGPDDMVAQVITFPFVAVEIDKQPMDLTVIEEMVSVQGQTHPDF